MHARAGADVHDIVSRADRVLIVLDDDERVAEVAQAAQRVEQLVVVALVQADARLVEDIEHAHQGGADLRGKADALGLAAGERRGRAGQRQVPQAHALQEAEAGADLAQDLLGDDGLRALEPQIVHECQLAVDWHVAEFRDGQAADGHGAGDIGQAAAMAVRAGGG